jgi:cAMP phosphodiesterase
MIVKVGGCYGGVAPGFNSVGFLLNESLLLEGGTVTSVFNAAEQEAIKYILVSHIHLDHTKEIFFLLDNLAQMGADAVTLAGTDEVVEGARKHLFNQQIWPDFSVLPSEESPVLKFQELPEDVFTRLGEFEIMPIAVNHPVPATGFVIRDGGGSIVYTGDTGPTKKIWETARREEGLKAVFAETSFPNSMEKVARASGHITPALLERELDLLNRPGVPVYIFHMKPLFAEEIREELEALGIAELRLLEQGALYEF